MINSLYNFYRSKDWINFRKYIIQQRGLICEECGKTIFEAGQAIIHHIQHLTEKNYLDKKISLNPANVKIICPLCHNKIHNRVFIKQKVIIVLTPPFSPSWENWKRENIKESDFIYDINKIWDCFSEFGYKKPSELNQIIFSIANNVNDLIKQRAGNNTNYYYHISYRDEKKIERLFYYIKADKIIYINDKIEDCLTYLDYNFSEMKEKFSKFVVDFYPPPSNEFFKNLNDCRVD